MIKSDIPKQPITIKIKKLVSEMEDSATYYTKMKNY